MDADYEKKAIAKHNAQWATRKIPKPNIKKTNHPWYWTDGQVAKRIEQPGYFENNIHKD